MANFWLLRASINKNWLKKIKYHNFRLGYRVVVFGPLSSREKKGIWPIIKDLLADAFTLQLTMIELAILLGSHGIIDDAYTWSSQIVHNIVRYYNTITIYPSSWPLMLIVCPIIDQLIILIIVRDKHRQISNKSLHCLHLHRHSRSILTLHGSSFELGIQSTVEITSLLLTMLQIAWQHLRMTLTPHAIS